MGLGQYFIMCLLEFDLNRYVFPEESKRKIHQELQFSIEVISMLLEVNILYCCLLESALLISEINNK